MPSIRSLPKYAVSAFGAAQAVLGNSLSYQTRQVFRGTSASCPNAELSCHNTTAVSNLCCFNAPGGQLLQTQFWDTNPSTGPSNSWTVHGLWPDHCDGTYDANCDSTRAYTNITQILESFGATSTLSYMQTYWKDYQGNDESFWEHEWGKHGTCISTLLPTCYSGYQPGEEAVDFFTRTVDLFQTLPSYTWLEEAGITPSSSTTYTSQQIQDALSKHHGFPVYLGCKSGALDEIWYAFDVMGSIQTGTFVAVDLTGASSTCPSTGIRYLPKSGSPAPSGSPSSTSAGSSPTTASSTRSPPTSTSPTSGAAGPTSPPNPKNPGKAFSGKGRLQVQTGGSNAGCIISKGTWYTTGTCATFTANASSTGDFTLRSSKGSCAIADGALTCGATIGTGSVFTSSGNILEYNGNSTFYADSIPSGATQGHVYIDDGHSMSLQMSWQSV